MRNTIGILFASAGAGLVAWPFSHTIAYLLAGTVLFLGAVFLLIDWDGR